MCPSACNGWCGCFMPWMWIRILASKGASNTHQTGHNHSWKTSNWSRKTTWTHLISTKTLVTRLKEDRGSTKRFPSSLFPWRPQQWPSLTAARNSQLPGEQIAASTVSTKNPRPFEGQRSKCIRFFVNRSSPPARSSRVRVVELVILWPKWASLRLGHWRPLSCSKLGTDQKNFSCFHQPRYIVSNAGFTWFWRWQADKWYPTVISS